jgi:REP element-mobilizing transposase RayT
MAQDDFLSTRRHLPHIEDAGATYFITFSLRRPPAVDLTTLENGQILISALRYLDGKLYSLYDYTVMPDHLHCIIRPLRLNGSTVRLSRIYHSFKSWTAQKINNAEGRSGPLWQDESYDHIIRNREDYEEKAAYILDNPRRRGLVVDGAQWPWWGKGSCT